MTLEPWTSVTHLSSVSMVAADAGNFNLNSLHVLIVVFSCFLEKFYYQRMVSRFSSSFRVSFYGFHVSILNFLWVSEYLTCIIS